MADPGPLPWWKSILSDGTGTGSSRRVLLFLTVMATLVFCGWHVWKRGLDQQVKDILTWLTSTLALLAGHGKVEERKAAAAQLQAAPGAPPAPGASP